MTKLPFKLAAALLGLCLALPGTPAPLAAVRGPCSDCHTMHHSQDGGRPLSWGEDGPYESLLTTSCIACHSGRNDGSNLTPYVYDPDGPTYAATGTESNSNTLAGGNFYWTTTNATRGHNVSGLCPEDPYLPTPPGFAGGQAAGYAVVVLAGQPHKSADGQPV